MRIEMGDGHEEIRSQINVTPLVDVCLVLLIIFMVVTPILTDGVVVELPKTRDPERKPEGSNQIRVSLSLGSPPRIHIGASSIGISERDFAGQMKDLYRSSPGKEVVVRADRRLKYGEIKTVLKAIAEAGFPQTGLIVEQEGKQ